MSRSYVNHQRGQPKNMDLVTHTHTLNANTAITALLPSSVFIGSTHRSGA